MQLKNKCIEIPEDFPFQHDILNRGESAEVLTEFVNSTKEPLVLCIDAPWGQGKTTFLTMWKQYLKNNEVQTIYYNAWENDFTDDAFISLLGEIGSAIEGYSLEAEGKTKQYYNKAKKIGLGLVKRSVPIAAKVATAGALDLDKITEQALSSLAEIIAKEKIENYEKSKKSLKEFRKELSSFANELAKKNNKPLVFIIDELDRCRPNFSIEILEKAKHFFNVENIIFVLGADKTQLGHSIKSVYGSEIDVNGYLRRFIDLDYLLPKPEKGAFVKSLFIKFSFEDYFSSKNNDATRYEGEQTLSMFIELFDLLKLSLREQEQCCSILSLAIKTTSKNQQLHPLFLCLLIVLKIKEPSFYKSLVLGDTTPKELLSYIENLHGADKLLSSNYGFVLEAYIMTCKIKHYNGDNVIDDYQKVIDSPKVLNNVLKARATRIIKIINNLDYEGGLGSLSFLIKKIEIATRFVN